MDTVRVGVVGLGNMGSSHAAYLAAGGVTGATLAAVCDLDPARRAATAAKSGATAFATHAEMLASGAVDAVIVAVPHYDHVPITLAAFDAGVHVLCEKPVAVSVSAARRVNAAAARVPDVKFGVMFNQRTNPMYQKLRELVVDGELGEVTRVSWIITDWFRTWTYYASGGWRATWAGEGGGVLINQCPHNLDLIQWIPGGMMPSRVTAVASIGKTHPIEVEDEVSAILEYPSGAIGHFVTTTGEAPGTNRLEICGDRGRVVAEGGKLLFRRARRSVREVRERSPLSFAPVETWDCEIPYGERVTDEHKAMTQNFVNAITKGTPMLGPGVEGVRGLEIGNAMLLAGLTREPVELPIDGDRYDAFLLELGQRYAGRKTLATAATGPVDLAGSQVR
jgi:predicted dehydrogenase